MTLQLTTEPKNMRISATESRHVNVRLVTV